MLDEINLYRMLNIVIAIASIPPSVFLLHSVSVERTKVHPKSKIINDILRRLFFLSAIVSMLNALLSFALVINFDFGTQFFGQSLFNTRNLIVNLMISLTTWGFSIIVKHERVKGDDAK